MDIVYKWICLLSWIWFSKPDIGFKLGYMINRLFQVFSTWGFWSRKTPKKWGLHQQQKTVSYATENPNVNGNIFHGLIIFNRYTWKKSLKWIWGMHSRNHHHARGFCTVKKPNPDRPIVVKSQSCVHDHDISHRHTYILSLESPSVILMTVTIWHDLSISINICVALIGICVCIVVIYIYIIHMCMCIYIYIYTCTCACTCTYIYTLIQTYIKTHIDMHMSICTHRCMWLISPQMQPFPKLAPMTTPLCGR